MEIEEKELDGEVEEVKLYLPKAHEMIYMSLVASRMHRNVIGPSHLSHSDNVHRNWSEIER